MNKNYQELVKDRIFFGGANGVDEMMQKESADLIIDLRNEVPEEELITNKVHSPLVGNDNEEREKSVRKAIEHVVSAYEDNKKVYFHCGGGNSKAGTVAVGTLLALGKAKTIEEAEEIAKSIRPSANIKPDMKEALKNIFPNA